MSQSSETGSTGTQAGNDEAKLYDAAGNRIETSTPQPKKGPDDLARLAREQPLAAALLALVVGYILGKIT